MIVYMYYGLLPEIKLSYLILSYLILSYLIKCNTYDQFKHVGLNFTTYLHNNMDNNNNNNFHDVVK